MKSLCWAALWALLSIAVHALPAQVIVIRHAEKPKDKNAKDLSETGRDRAERLVSYFKENPEITRFGLPSILIAARPTKDGGGLRTSETLQPLAKELKLPVRTPYQSEHSDKLGALLRASSEYDGKNVLVCWTHERMPQLMEALGVRPAPGKVPDDAYDRVYVIRYDGTTPTLQMLYQDMPSSPDKKQPKDEKKGGKKKFRW